MTTYALFRDAIKAVTAVTSGRPLSAISWADEAVNFSSDPKITLNILASTPYHDRVIRDVVQSGPNAGNKSVDLESMHDLTVTFRVETTNAGGAMNALAYAEKIRVGFWRASVFDALRAAEIAWIGELSGIARHDYTIDGRRVCCYSVDMQFRAILSSVPSDEIVGTIEHVEIQGTLTPGPITTDQTVDRP